MQLLAQRIVLFMCFGKKLWYLPTPHKVRHFAWRACRGILPTKDNLQQRRVLSENLCDECGTAAESSGHFSSLA